MIADQRRVAAALLLLCLSCCTVDLTSGSVVIDHDGDAYTDEQFVQAELYPAAPRDGSKGLLAEWSHFIMGVSGLLAVHEGMRDPSEHPHVLAPDQRGTPGFSDQYNYDYEPQRIGKVLPNDLTPLTEGSRPPLHGYFQQSAECDQFLRLWADQCAFKDEGENVYHAGPKEFYEDGEDGERKSSSTYLKEVLGKWESNSHMAKSAERFGGQPKTTDEEPPVDIDDQVAPPN